jgi:hypothetical protein
MEISFEVFEKGRGFDISLELTHLQYGSIFTTCLKDADTDAGDKRVWETGMYHFIIELPLFFLREGEYMIAAAASIPKIEELDTFKYNVLFNILDSTSPVAKTTEGRNGAVLPVLEWVKK